MEFARRHIDFTALNGSAHPWHFHNDWQGVLAYRESCSTCVDAQCGHAGSWSAGGAIPLRANASRPDSLIMSVDQGGLSSVLISTSVRPDFASAVRMSERIASIAGHPL